MNKIILTITLICIFATFFGQIANSDFEKSRDTISSLPNNWGIKKIEGFEFLLDNENKVYMEHFNFPKFKEIETNSIAV